MKDRQAIGSIDKLLAFAVGQVTAAGEECTFERLVCECFKLFPNEFGMQRYPDWPDSVRVDKTWRRCRTDKGWIIGSVQEGFRLTDRGSQIVSNLGRILDTDEPSAPLVNTSSRARERHEAMLKYIRRQPAFADYQADPDGFELTESGLRVLLNGTLETPHRVLRQNLHAYQNAAEVHKDAEVASFLEASGKLLKEAVLGRRRFQQEHALV